MSQPRFAFMLSLVGVALLASACQSPSTSVTPSLTAQAEPSRFRCGDMYVRAYVDTVDRLTLEIDNRPYRLQPVPVASGAKYETAKSMLPNIAFHNQGDQARLAINSKPVVTCQKITAIDAAQAEKLGQQIPIVNTEWAVEEINGKTVIDYPKLVLTFGDNGRIAGFSGCNRYAADYTVVDDNLHIGPIASTRKACTARALNEQEARFTTLLATMNYARVSTSGALWLTNDQGDNIRLKVAPVVPAAL